MTDDITVLKIKEILSQDYQTSADKSADIVNLCDQLSEALSSQEHASVDFYVRFVQNLRLFLNSEFFFLNNRIDNSLSNFQKLRESISKTQNEFPEYYAQWQYDIDRLLLRIDARTQNLRAHKSLQTEDTAQAEILFTETIKRYSTELELEQASQDYFHYFDSLRNIYYISGLLFKLKGNRDKNSKELYQALRLFRKARFLGQESSNADFDETREEIIALTMQKLETQAEGYFTSGVVFSQDELFHEAMKKYSKSAQVFRSLRKLKDSVEFELQEQIQLSSYYEALAKDLISKDNNEQAAMKFLYAKQTLERVLSNIPSEGLIATFEPQIQYFDAMCVFCQAVVEYDKLQPEAIQHFSEAAEKLEQAKEKAISLNNTPLVEGCDEAIKKISSYEEIAELMFQSEPED
ncbi:MAG: hypothetical protein ACTSRJ_01960 [Candidatus Hodarchaeales archaeon]